MLRLAQWALAILFVLGQTGCGRSHVRPDGGEEDAGREDGGDGGATDGSADDGDADRPPCERAHATGFFDQHPLPAGALWERGWIDPVTREIWVPGSTREVIRWGCAGETRLPTGETELVTALWGDGAGVVWATTEGGAILRWDGVVWSRVRAPASVFEHLMAVSGTGPADVWVVGDVSGGQAQALAFHFDGTAWSEAVRGPAVPAGAFFPSIAAIAPDDVWIVGSMNASPEGTSLHFDGAAWTNVPGGNFNGIWASGQAELWVAGGGGVFRRIANGWSLELDGQFRGLWGASSNDIWVAGSDGEVPARGTLVHFDGASFAAVSVGELPPVSHLGRVWGADRDDVWVIGRADYPDRIGYYQIVLHFDGTSWLRIPYDE